MSPEQMRDAIIDAYGGDWPHKVLKMSEKKVVAVYMRLLNTNPDRLKTGVTK